MVGCNEVHILKHVTPVQNFNHLTILLYKWIWPWQKICSF